MKLTPDEQRVLMALTQSRTGAVLIDMLERRQKSHFEAWLNRLDDGADAHLRGKASELRDLLTLLKSLSQSKE